MTKNIYLYIAIMALTTYAIRMLPLALIKRQIKSPFVKSFLYYVPFAALAAMTFPAILYSTDSLLSAGIGFVTALVLSYRKKSLLTVALFASLAVFLTELIMKLV